MGSSVARVLLLLALLAPVTAKAQDGIRPDTERMGHRLFTQNCAICHLKPQITTPRFGPELNRATVEGKEDAVRGFIETGTPRMPGFRYDLAPGQIDAILLYLGTIPVTPPPPGAPASDQGGMR